MHSAGKDKDVSDKNVLIISQKIEMSETWSNVRLPPPLDYTELFVSYRDETIIHCLKNY